MAIYAYNYKCGHGQGQVQVYGKISERQSKVDWYSRTHVCPDCYRAQVADARKKEEEKNAKIAEMKKNIDGNYKSSNGHTATIMVVTVDNADVTMMGDDGLTPQTIRVSTTAILQSISDGKIKKI